MLVALLLSLALASIAANTFGKFPLPLTHSYYSSMLTSLGAVNPDTWCF